MGHDASDGMAMFYSSGRSNVRPPLRSEGDAFTHILFLGLWRVIFKHFCHRLVDHLAILFGFGGDCSIRSAPPNELLLVHVGNIYDQLPHWNPLNGGRGVTAHPPI